MKIVVISGSPRKQAVTQVMMKFVHEYTKSKNAETKFINLSDGMVDCYKGYDVTYSDTTTQAAKDIMDADVWLIGTPIYNSFFSAALKNLFEYVNYKSTAGKTAGLAILASGTIGFTDVQTLLTQLMSYFKVITNPKVVFMTVEQIKDGTIEEASKVKLRELVDETILLASRPK
ncbi:MAG: NAD(P)H-dependent oxidoreductase [Thaumarchaeota archaeon]|nr:NAD(P)H-dependent oxidoreductase [Nitrososphaerota archaeon]